MRILVSYRGTLPRIGSFMISIRNCLIKHTSKEEYTLFNMYPASFPVHAGRGSWKRMYR